jgi:hypothetical protein
MPNVKDVLRSYQIAAPELGRSATQRTAESLARDLDNVSRSNRGYFFVCFGCVVTLFVAAGVIVVRFVDDPARIQTLFTVLGISVMGLIAQMVHLWKQKVSADLLIVLSQTANHAQLSKIIDGLLAKL